MKDHNEKLYSAGKKMGFMRGGQVKDTGNQPARKGSSQQEIEAGGTPKLKPGYKQGGAVKRQSTKSAKERAMYKAFSKELKAAPGPAIRAAGPNAAKKANDAQLKVLKKYRAKAKAAGLSSSLFSNK